ncbi:MAG TPA: kynureninase [Trueperaceae bacterium]|nr:kynureninase [Trueperaceae bacterium]
MTPRQRPDDARQRALRLDAADGLARFRELFVHGDEGRIYLDGNSLGRLPEATRERLRRAVDEEWGRELIASWGRGWFDAPLRTGERLAPLVGAAPGQVAFSDSTTVNLYKLAGAALQASGERRRVVTDAMNFPSDIYTLHSVARTVGAGASVHVVPGDGVQPDMARLLAAIDEDTALVVLSHVTFKSGYLHDARAVTARAREVGAWVLWDLSHSVGVVPIELDAWGAALAVGCSYKYLNGGPGAPAFLYVRRELQERLRSPVEGWFGRARPFGFDLDFQPAQGVQRFLVGTPPVLSLLAVEVGLEPLLEAGVAGVRAKSEALTAFLIERFDARLAPLGLRLGTPRDPARRGSHVSVLHPDGYRVARALLGAGVVPDFREPDAIRLGLAPLYTRFLDVYEAVERLARVVEEGAYLRYDGTRAAVT